MSSGSTESFKPPAEPGTVSAELARDSSELLVKGRKRRDVGKDKPQRVREKGTDKERKGRKTFR